MRTNGQKTVGNAARHALALIIFAYCIADFALEAKADSQITVSAAQAFLFKYGYLSSDNSVNQSMTSTTAISSAISRFQSFMRIPVTGTMNNQTSHLMTSPRCGIKDIVESRRDHGSAAYKVGGSGWGRKNLTYRINNYPRTLDRVSVDQEIARAFAVWSQYTDLKFSPRSGKADIEIRFVSGVHGECREPFDSSSDVIAHAFFPEYSGEVHFNNAKDWTIDTNRGINLFQVAAHEFGHALGLGHSNITSALMFPRYSSYDPNFMLDTDDINGIRAIYGPKTTGKHDEVPQICDDPRVDAMLASAEGDIYAFKGEHYWTLTTDENAVDHPKLIATKWIGLPGNIDAAVTHNQKTYFFKGSKYWRYVGSQLDLGYPKEISETWPQVPNHLDAATVWTGNGNMFLFKGDDCWEVNPPEQQQGTSTSTDLNPNWELVARDVDAILGYRGWNVFFKGGNFNVIEDMGSQVVDPRWQSNEIWFGCDSVNQQSRSTNGSGSIIVQNV